jgi:hypothetical protein
MGDDLAIFHSLDRHAVTSAFGARRIAVCLGSRLCKNPARVFAEVLGRRHCLIIRARGRVLATDEKPQTQALIASIKGPAPMMAITRFRL